MTPYEFSKISNMNELAEALIGHTFDDFILRPQLGILHSRDPDEIDLSGKFSRNIVLKRPIVSANMDTITRASMAIAMAELGGLGVIDRGFKPGEIEPQIKEVLKVKRAQHGIITDPYRISKDASLLEAKRIMGKSGVGSLVILNDENILLGLITERDIRFRKDLDSTKVEDTMISRHKLIVLIDSEQLYSFDEAIKLMIEHRVKKIPVVDADNKLLGLYTAKDILKHQSLPFASRDKKGRLMVGAAIGARGDYLERAEELIGAEADVIVIDIAHGHSVIMIEAVENFRKRFGDFELVAGNVGTAGGAGLLYNLEVDGIKVGIGPGGGCTTRLNTNCGVSQFQAIAECYAMIPENVPIIADGGVNRDGHLIMALLGGAQTVMLGSVFAGTEETPGDIIYKHRKDPETGKVETIPYKRFRGMASVSAIASRLDVEEAEVELLEEETIGAEGLEVSTPLSGSAGTVFKRMINHLCSSISYLGGKDLPDIKKKFESGPGRYLIKQTHASKRESFERKV